MAADYWWPAPAVVPVPDDYSPPVGCSDAVQADWAAHWTDFSRADYQADSSQASQVCPEAPVSPSCATQQ
jgi:hypothetical protein